MDDRTTLQFYAPIEKTDEEQRMVYGYASTEALDSQGEVVKKEALKDALADYMKFANIREMHQPSAVGKTKKANLDSKGMYIAAKVVDDKAWQKVKEGVYNGFSIGGRVKTMVDNEITGLSLSEISLVDRPANPEAVFDVYKADDIDTEKRDFSAAERKDMAASGKALPDGSFPIANEEDLHNAIRLYGHAKDKAAAKKHIVERAKAMGLTSALPDDWKTTKADEPTMTKEQMIAQMEKMLIMLKGEAPVEPTEPEAPAEEVKEETPVEEVKTETPEAPKEEAPTEPEAPAEPEVPAEEVKEEYREFSEKTEMEKIDEALKAGKMPSDEQLVYLLKSQEIETTDNHINVLKYKLADKILEYITKGMDEQEEKDALALQVKKEQEKTPIVLASKKHQFDGVLVLINKLEKAMNEQSMNHHTTASVETLPTAEVPNGGHQDSDVLSLLQQAVAMLTAQNQGKQLTPNQKDVEANGAVEGSERDSGGHFDPKNVVANPAVSGSQAAVIQPGTPIKADIDPSLAKVEKLNAEMALIKAELQTLKNTPVPVKAYASYATVEKFEKNSSDNADVELEKAVKRADELHELMKAHPGNQDYVKEAQALSSTIMRLQREVKQAA